MAEPIPQTPETAPIPPVVVGETPIYLKTPVDVDGTQLQSITILGANKRALEGVGSAVPLVREASRRKGEEGKLIDKPLTNLNDFDEVPWEKVSGVQWTDEKGIIHVVSKDELALTPPAKEAAETPQTEAAPVSSDTAPVSAEQQPTPEGTVQAGESPQEAAPTAEAAVEATPETAGEVPAEVPETPAETLPPSPVPAKEARTVLESLIEDPNTITIVGLKAYETRALDLADRSMQKLGTAKYQERLQAQNSVWERVKSNLEGIKRFAVENMWKQSIGGIYFHEKARQYYMDMLNAAETPFAEDAIRMAERRATDRYNAKLADTNFVVRIGTKAVDALRDFTGMRTTVQKMALEEIGAMKAKGELTGAETFEREAKAVRARFAQDMDSAASFVRQQLGEKLEILNPENAEHKPLVEGIQTLLKQYATGEIPDKAEFDIRTKEFFESTLKNVRPDIFAEAELYSSSLFEAAENLRMKMSHEAGLTNIDDALSQMQIRLGLGQMGEVTSLEPTAVEKGVGRVREVMDWLNKRNVIVPMVFNEATVGSAVALALSATKFISTMPARALAGIGGGALAGGVFAGWREYGQLQRDYLTHLRERESGANFTEMQKKRAWFEKFAPKQRSASEMINTIQSSLYDESGALKGTLTDDELRTVFATVADTQARKAVSEIGPKRIGLIRYTSREAIESERAALDITANKALGDLESYLAGHPEQVQTVLGENTFEDFMVKLTSGQTDVLRQGVQTAEAFEDPVKNVLGIVSEYAPEATIVKRRWPFASRLPTDADKALGMDAIIEEFNKEARVEAVKYGVRAGVIGAAVGEMLHLVQSLPHAEIVTKGGALITDKAHATATEHVGSLTATHDNLVHVGTNDYELPPEISVHENLNHTFDAVIHSGGKDITIADNVKGDQLLDHLKSAGLQIKPPEVVYTVPTHEVAIPDLTTKFHDPITAQLPPGFHFNHIQGNGTWSLMDNHNTVVADNIRFNPDGSVVNHADLASQVTAHGLRIDAPNTTTLTLDHPNSVMLPDGKLVPADSLHQVTPTPEAPTVASEGTMTLDGKSLDNGGLWNHFMKQAQGEHTMSTTNGVKNMFRLYEQYQVPHDANGLPTNITVDHGSTAQLLHLRDATYAGTPVKEFDIAKIPDAAHLNLPKELFSPEAIKHFGELNDKAIAHYQTLVDAGKSPMDAIHTLEQSNVEADKVDAVLLRLGYFGRDSDFPSQADMSHLYHAMGLGTATPAPIPQPPVGGGEIPVTPVEIHPIHIYPDTHVTNPGIIYSTNGIDIPYELTGKAIEFTAKQGVDTLPWIPIFLPYREALEPVEPPVEGATVKPGDVMYSPYGSEESFLTRAQVDSRKSPRLSENAAAALNQHEEIAWYLNTLTPEEQALSTELLSQITTPVSPDVRTVVTLPVSGNGASIYQRLSAYTNQVDAEGNPLAPTQSEIVVYDVLTGDQQPDQTKAEVDRFTAEHPDTHVVYMTHTYAEPPAGGRVKRDVSNAVLTRLSSLPEDAKDVALISDNGTGTPVQPTYISSAIAALEQNPTLDIVSGTVTLPTEAFANYPMLFAQHRAFELFDSLARHGDMDAVPYVYNGNMAIRAGTLAAVGGYNENSTHLDERQLAWVTKAARGNATTSESLSSMAVTIEPKDVVYKHLQALGIADAATPLEQNEVYNAMSWQEMAQKANDAYTKEQFESDINAMYDSLYPSLKSSNPDRFNAYFKRTMDAMGVGYEITDGKIVITDTSKLAENMSTDLDMESFAKTAAAEVAAATPPPAETSRESLEQLAGVEPQQEAPKAPEETVATGIQSPEVTVEAPAEELPSEQTVETPPAMPEGAQEAVASTIPAPEVQEAPTQPEQMPEGVEDKIRYVLEKAKENGAVVSVSPGELMDYIKSSVDIAGSRITGGTIMVEGKTVKLSDMKAHTPVGDAHFSGELISDPNRGLVVNRDALQLKLPLLARIMEGTIRQNLNNFNMLMLDHINSKFDQQWKANRIDIVNDTLQIRFNRKPGSVQPTA